MHGEDEDQGCRRVVKPEEKSWADVDQESVMVTVHRVVCDVTDTVLLSNQSKATRQNPLSLILLSQVSKGRV